MKKIPNLGLTIILEKSLTKISGLFEINGLHTRNLPAHMIEDIQLQPQVEQDLALPPGQLPPRKVLRKIEGGRLHPRVSILPRNCVSDINSLKDRSFSKTSYNYS